ncbi:hypothetical protein F5141DRAFT_1203624 [Pisolithus sp. B1]|nr:hypothetical protein F5141DRAFT_1203624 [Pisolithus sp. B1]
MSSEALETQGNLPFTTSECAETRTGHRKPKNKVVDTRQVVDVLPMFEVGSTGQTWHGKHVKELKAPDERCQCADDVAVCRDLPESRSEAPEPADNISGQAGGRSMQDGPQIPSQENQHAGMNSKTIANVLDPPGLCSRLQPVRNQPTWDDLPSKEVNGSGGHDDAPSGGCTDSHGVKELLLTDKGSQHCKHNTKREGGSPAPPTPSPNGIMDMPTPFTDLRQHGRIKGTAERAKRLPCPSGLRAATYTPLRALEMILGPSGRVMDGKGKLYRGQEHQKTQNKRAYAPNSRHSHAAASTPLQSLKATPEHRQHILAEGGATWIDAERRDMAKKSSYGQTAAWPDGQTTHLRHPNPLDTTTYILLGPLGTDSDAAESGRKLKTSVDPKRDAGKPLYSPFPFRHLASLRDPSGMLQTLTGDMGYPPDGRETSKIHYYSIQWPSGNGTRRDDARTPCAFRKRKLPQVNDASTQPHHTRYTHGLEAH